VSARTLAIDFALAAVIVAILIAVSPGLAVVGMVAVGVLLLCGLSLVGERLVVRRRLRRRARG